jgi:hypothetical protein
MSDASVYVSSVLPPELVQRMDLKIAEARVQMLRTEREDAIIPTRSSWIKRAILHYLTCPHANGSGNHKKE